MDYLLSISIFLFAAISSIAGGILAKGSNRVITEKTVIDGWNKVHASRAQIIGTYLKAFAAVPLMCVFIPPWAVFSIGVDFLKGPDLNILLALSFSGWFWYWIGRFFVVAHKMGKIAILWNEDGIMPQSVAIEKHTLLSWPDLVDVRRPSFLSRRIISRCFGSPEVTLVFRDGTRISYYTNMHGSARLKAMIATHHPADQSMSPGSRYR